MVPGKWGNRRSCKAGESKCPGAERHWLHCLGAGRLSLTTEQGQSSSGRLSSCACWQRNLSLILRDSGNRSLTFDAMERDLTWRCVLLLWASRAHTVWVRGSHTLRQWGWDTLVTRENLGEKVHTLTHCMASLPPAGKRGWLGPSGEVREGLSGSRWHVLCMN